MTCPQCGNELKRLQPVKYCYFCGYQAFDIWNDHNRKERITKMKVEDIAITCHEINRMLCIALGDHSQKHWNEAPDWQKDSAINGVEFHIANPEAGDDASHNQWMKEKIDNGWIYGEEKDEEKKTHPCLVPFDELPKAQQLKDVLFRNIVLYLKD